MVLLFVLVGTWAGQAGEERNEEKRSGAEFPPNRFDHEGAEFFPREEVGFYVRV